MHLMVVVKCFCELFWSNENGQVNQLCDTLEFYNQGCHCREKRGTGRSLLGISIRILDLIPRLIPSNHPFHSSQDPSSLSLSNLMIRGFEGDPPARS